MTGAEGRKPEGWFSLEERGMQPAIGVQWRSPHLTARRLQLCYFALKRDFTLARGFVCSPDSPSRNPCCVLGCASPRQVCCAVCWPLLPWGLAPILSLHPSYTQAGSLWPAAWKAPDLPFCATLFHGASILTLGLHFQGLSYLWPPQP